MKKKADTQSSKYLDHLYGLLEYAETDEERAIIYSKILHQRPELIRLIRTLDRLPEDAYKETMQMLGALVRASDSKSS